MTQRNLMIQWTVLHCSSKFISRTTVFYFFFHAMNFLLKVLKLKVLQSSGLNYEVFIELFILPFQCFCYNHYYCYYQFVFWWNFLWCIYCGFIHVVGITSILLKIYCRGCYFQVGPEVKLNMSVEDAYRQSVETVVDWIGTHVNTSKSQVYFRSYAPVHFRFAAPHSHTQNSFSSE